MVIGGERDNVKSAGMGGVETAPSPNRGCIVQVSVSGKASPSSAANTGGDIN